MSQANDNFEILSNYFGECRKLEEKDWNDYLNHEYNTGEVLVYHFKRKAELEKHGTYKEFSGLVKISTNTSSKKRILTYVIMMIILGVISGLIAGWISYSKKDQIGKENLHIAC